MSKYLFESCIESVNVCHDVDNYSDYAPLLLRLNNMNWFDYGHVSEKNGTCKTAWYKATDRHLQEYKRVLCYHLDEVCLPRDLLTCHDVKCCNVNHSSHLCRYANDIIQACIKQLKK